MSENQKHSGSDVVNAYFESEKSFAAAESYLFPVYVVYKAINLYPEWIIGGKSVILGHICGDMKEIEEKTVCGNMRNYRNLPMS